MSGMGVFLFWEETYSIGWTRWGGSKRSKLRWGTVRLEEAKTSKLIGKQVGVGWFKMIQADRETGGSWVVQNDPS